MLNSCHLLSKLLPFSVLPLFNFLSLVGNCTDITLTYFYKIGRLWMTFLWTWRTANWRGFRVFADLFFAKSRKRKKSGWPKLIFTILCLYNIFTRQCSFGTLYSFLPDFAYIFRTLYSFLPDFAYIWHTLLIFARLGLYLAHFIHFYHTSFIYFYQTLHIFDKKLVIFTRHSVYFLLNTIHIYKKLFIFTNLF